MIQLTKEGQKESEAVARRLKGYLEQEGEDFRLTGIIAATSAESNATAEIVRKELGLLTVRSLELLTPITAFNRTEYKDQNPNARNPANLARLLAREVNEVAAKLVSKRGEAVLVVGHQPLLGWISYSLVGEAHPIAHSEVLCFQLDEPIYPSPRWVISPSDEETLQDLREKIQSKMEVAKLLSAFIVAGLAFLASTIPDPNKVGYLGVQLVPVGAGALCLFVALTLYLAAMCSYDTLLMPRRFWSETPVGHGQRPAWIVARPPSSAHWVLYQNMLRVWQYQFIPATYSLILGLLLLGSAVFSATLPLSRCADFRVKVIGLIIPFIVPAAAGFILVVSKCKRLKREVKAAWLGFSTCPGLTNKFRYVFGPWLGSED